LGRRCHLSGAHGKFALADTQQDLGVGCTREGGNATVAQQDRSMPAPLRPR
jgi:hypothetical protein